MDERAKIVRATYLAPRPAWPLGIPQTHAASRCRSLPRARSLFPRRSTPNRPAADMPLTVRLQSLLLEGEAMLAKHKHPDPYILPWRPGGTMYHRNPPPVPEVRADSSFLLVVQRSVHFAAHNSLLRLSCRCAHSWNSRNKVRSATPSTPRSHRTPCARTLLQASLSPELAQVGRTWRGAAAARRAASAHGEPRAPPRSPPAAAPGR